MSLFGHFTLPHFARVSFSFLVERHLQNTIVLYCIMFVYDYDCCNKDEIKQMMMKTEVMKLNTITIFPTNIVSKNCSIFLFISFVCVRVCVDKISLLSCVRALINWTNLKNSIGTWLSEMTRRKR